MEKIIKFGLFLASLTLMTSLLFSMASIDSETKSFSPLVLLAFVGVLGLIGTYTYTRFFDEGAIALSNYLLWGLVASASAVIAFVYVWNLSSSTSPELFNRFAPIPAALSFFFAVAATAALGGDRFLGPLRSIIRLGTPPEKPSAH